MTIKGDRIILTGLNRPGNILEHDFFANDCFQFIEDNERHLKKLSG